MNCNYDSDLQPRTTNSKPVKVRVKFILKTLKFSKDEEKFNVYSWVVLIWKDDRLTWGPEKYGDIRNIGISFRIWIPSLKDYTIADDTNDYEFYYNSCQVRNTGKVICYLTFLHHGLCSTDLQNWPYDTQSCILRFGERKRSGTHKPVQFTFGNKTAVILWGDEYITGWTLISFNKTEDYNNTEQLTITFGLERQSVLLSSMIVVPSIIVFLITMISLLLFVNNPIRLGLLYFDLLLHYVILHNISSMLPKHSRNVPKILLFTRGSLLLTFISVLLTFFVKILRKRKQPPPLFISLLNNYVNNSFIKHFLWPKWEADNNVWTLSDEVERKTTKNWNDFTNLVNTSFIFIFSIVYFCLFLFNMPIFMVSQS